MSKHSFSKDELKRIAIASVSLCIMVLFWFILSKIGVIVHYIGLFIDAVSPIILGLVMAFLLAPVMNMWTRAFKWCYSNAFKNAGKDKIKKASSTTAVIFTLITFLAIFAVFLSIVIPALKDSILKLYDSIPDYVDVVSKWAENILKNNSEIEDYVLAYLDEFQTSFMDIIKDKLLPNIDTIISAVSTGIIGGINFVVEFFVGLVAAIYVLSTKEKMLAQCKKAIYCLFDKKNGNKVVDAFSYMNSVFGGFINGKIIDSFIIGIICAIFCNLVEMPYAALVSVIVGVTNVVPYFGPFIGAIPSAILILVDDPKMAVVFVIFVIILQQIDGNIIGPMILGDSTGLTGFWVLFAIIVGGNLFGFMGMLLGVPVFACIYTAITILLRDKLHEKGLTSQTEFYQELYRFNEDGEPIFGPPPKKESPKKRRQRMDEFAKKQLDNLHHLIEHESPKKLSKNDDVSESAKSDNAKSDNGKSGNAKSDNAKSGNSNSNNAKSNNDKA